MFSFPFIRSTRIVYNVTDTRPYLTASSCFIFVFVDMSGKKFFAHTRARTLMYVHFLFFKDEVYRTYTISIAVFRFWFTFLGCCCQVMRSFALFIRTLLDLCMCDAGAVSACACVWGMLFDEYAQLTSATEWKRACHSTEPLLKSLSLTAHQFSSNPVQNGI